jgi:hypothetical protein
MTAPIVASLHLTSTGPGSRADIIDYVRTVLAENTLIGADTTAERLARGIVTSILSRLGAGYSVATGDWTRKALEAAGVPQAEAQPDDDPMPVFTLKAKDELAVGIVAAYQTACRARGLHRQADEVQKAIEELVDWRARHTDLVKLPDHEHVPATRGGAR